MYVRLLITLIYHFNNHTIGVEVLNSVNLMGMKNALIIIKISKLRVVFVNVHCVYIRIVQ